MHPEIKGTINLLIAYFIWTIWPFYLKLFSNLSPYEVLAHRVFWGFIIFLVYILIFRKKLLTNIFEKITKKEFKLLFLSGFLISINWGIYIYSVQVNLVLQASLGYFIAPLLSMLFGFIILKEKVNLLQWVSILLAASGVIYLIVYYQTLPWIAFGLALSFSIYGLIHKKINLEANLAFLIETGILIPFTLIYFSILYFYNSLGFVNQSFLYSGGIILLGVFSSVPLVFFGHGVKLVRLILLGFIQFYMPTALFFIGVFGFGEEFQDQYKVTFILIWIAVFIFITNNLKIKKLIKK